MILLLLFIYISITNSTSTHPPNNLYNEPLNFRPITKGIALKMVKECVTKYHKLVEEQPLLANLMDLDSSAVPDYPWVSVDDIPQDQLEDVRFVWVNFRLILWNAVFKHAFKNLQMIIERCKHIAEQMNMTEYAFCEFGKILAFLKQYFVALKGAQSGENVEYTMDDTVDNKSEVSYLSGRMSEIVLLDGKSEISAESSEFVAECSGANLDSDTEMGAVDMFVTMEHAYEIGWNHQKTEFLHRSGRQWTPLDVDFDEAWFNHELDKATLRRIKFMHDFEPIDRHWAGSMLNYVRNQCKSYGLYGWKPVKTTKTEWYRRAFAMLDLVLLEEFESPQDNQIEILASCEALFDDQETLVKLCEFAKRLAYFGAIYTKFGFNRAKDAKCCGCIQRPPKLEICLGIVQQIYEQRIGQIGNKIRDGQMRAKFLEQMKYEKLAEDVELAIEAMPIKDGEKAEMGSSTEVKSDEDDRVELAIESEKSPEMILVKSKKLLK